MARLARAASYYQDLVLDDAPRTSLPVMLKSRSMSAPSLAIRNSFCDGSQQKQPTCSNVTITATVHDARLSDYHVGLSTFKFGKSDVIEPQTEEPRFGDHKV